MEHKTISFEIKALDGDGRTLEGFCAAFGNIDQVGDVIHPGAFRKTLTERGGRIKFLWQHDPTEPIGRLVEAREDTGGLYVKAVISDTQRGRDAIALLRDGAISEMSIGYEAVKGGTDYSKTPEGKSVRNLREIKLYEFSLVTFPANEAAIVTALKEAVPETDADEGEESEPDAEPEIKAGRTMLKYSDDQPRVPAGNPDGGQWTGSGGGSGDSSETESGDMGKTTSYSDVRKIRNEFLDAQREYDDASDELHKIERLLRNSDDLDGKLTSAYSTASRRFREAAYAVAKVGERYDQAYMRYADAHPRGKSMIYSSEPAPKQAAEEQEHKAGPVSPPTSTERLLKLIELELTTLEV